MAMAIKLTHQETNDIINLNSKRILWTFFSFFSREHTDVPLNFNIYFAEEKSFKLLDLWHGISMI